MINAIETALTFACGGEVLLGIVSLPEQPRHVGVLIIVGGPQYRVGSHRQFVLLARRLAAAGFPTMRFDYRGMGDSSGSPRAFDDVSEDIAAAIAALRGACPTVRKVVLWGLCDAASAALLYAHADSRAVDGLVLANPWIRSEATIARAQVQHYYGARLFDRSFWGKLVRGQVDLRKALGGFLLAARNAGRGARQRAAAAGQDRGSFRELMRSSMEAFPNPVLVLLSGRDLTAREFDDFTRADPSWRRSLARKIVQRCDVEDADHTFSSAAGRERVETATVEWIGRYIAGDAQ
jgi:exosortase A-associated hydrolase 1